jgi:hypothetical protein
MKFVWAPPMTVLCSEKKDVFQLREDYLEREKANVFVSCLCLLTAPD